MTESERIARLTQDAKNGDKQAFSELYSTFGKRVYFFCYGLLGDEAEAKNVTKDVFVYAWRNLHALPEKQTFYRWVCGNAFYFAKIALASQRGTGVSVTEAVGTVPEIREVTKGDDPNLRRSDLELAASLLVSLSDDERICVLLKDYVGFSDEECANIASCDAESVRVHSYNGKRSVCETMEQQLENPMELLPYFSRLIRTCGRNCELPEDLTEMIREELSKEDDDPAIPPVGVSGEKKPFPNKTQLSVIIAVLAAVLLGALIYIIWWFNSGDTADPSGSSSTPSDAITSEENSGEESNEIPGESSDESSSENSDESSTSESTSEPGTSESSETSSETSSEDPGEITVFPQMIYGTVDMDSGTLRIRENPSTSAGIVKSVAIGTRLEVTRKVITASGEEWYFVTYRPEGSSLYHQGYCYAEYIRLDEQAAE